MKSLLASLAFALSWLAAGCASLDPLPPADHVVAAPISVPANAVLANLITEFGSREGRWLNCMSDGCTQIWATQFGYRAGHRRDREDILEIGRMTAVRQAADLRSLLFKAIIGKFNAEDPALFGFPALLISGALGDRTWDGIMLSKGLDRLDELGADSMDRRQSAGLAALLAAAAQLQPGRKDERLLAARKLAEAAADGGGGTWSSLAWAAIARVSGSDADIDRAREAVGTSDYEFDPQTGALIPFESRDEILSRHLSMIHAMADLAQASGDGRYRDEALEILEYVFSEAYFDGRFLSHDLSLGRSENVCSGCNFMALYLVDRLYGDTFVIDPVPGFPKRRIVRNSGPPGEWDTTIFLAHGPGDEPAETENSIRPLASHGRIAFVHENEKAWVTMEYQLPHPTVRSSLVTAKIQIYDGGVVRYEVAFGFDDSGAARTVLGGKPLKVEVTFRRRDDGRCDGIFKVRDR